MKNKDPKKNRKKRFMRPAALVLALFFCFPCRAAEAVNVTVNVVNEQGSPVSGFKWLLEEDVTYPVSPGVRDSNSLALNFHKSHMPVSTSPATGLGQNGGTLGSSATIWNIEGNPAKPRRYFLSILPFSGYSMNGVPIIVNQPGQLDKNITVVVHSHPIPTAQISIFVFEDNQVLNGAPDLPEERGLGGPQYPFSIVIEEPGGQYGVAGGQVIQDAFGNPLGTVYDPITGEAKRNDAGKPLRGDGSIADGTLYPNENGVVVVKNLPPGKYGVIVTPPAGQGWIQTSTIEGSPVIDAWVKANEPSFFAEFGPPGHHVFVGFVKSFDCMATPNDPNCADAAGEPIIAPADPGATLSGRIVNNHLSRPPDYTFYNGQPLPACRIGLNQGVAGVGKTIYSGPCDADSAFSISSVPAGNYELKVWDDNLDIVIATLGVTVNPDGSCNTFDGECNFGEVPVFYWFTRLETNVFFDRNQNGIQDPKEPNLGADQAAVTLRFRDGRVYQSFPIDAEGSAPFDEIFPFFHWLVAEVSFTSLKATGATFVIDAGGPVVMGDVLNPQPQKCTAMDVAAGVDGCAIVGADRINPYTGDNLVRTETGPVLTQAFQGFLGQTSVMSFGKGVYGPNENGGISGIVFYATTRAEHDPRYAVGEEWEPGIPRVQVNLYKDADMDGKIDDVNGTGAVELSDVDNYPFATPARPFPAKEDIDRNGNLLFDLGDAIRFTTTDSWDDNLPEGCQGEKYIFPDGTPNGKVIDCFDGMRNFNQVRSGVFDGGYAFGPGDPNDPDDPPLPTGVYIVEAVPPPGYKLVKEEDKNVDFGDEYTPSQLLLPPVCVGDTRTVPNYLSFVTVNGDGMTLAPGINPAEVGAPFKGQRRPLCDRRQVRLSARQNAAADFFLFTDVPKAAHVVGGILNDLGNEFDPNSPNFGEKWAPPWVPVSFRDWTGREITRVYADEWGKFNAVLPSTYSVNLPMPSGVSPNMITACMNDAGPIPNPQYNPNSNANVPQTIIDPFFNPQFSQFCYVFQYMPGATTYLDTPVLPIAAFAGPGEALDCEQPDGTPMIAEVSVLNSALNPNGGPYAAVRDILVIKSAGFLDVPDPNNPQTGAKIRRDYRFGQRGGVAINGVSLSIRQWTPNIIRAQIPNGVTSGQLVVTNGDGRTSPIGVTVTVGNIGASRVRHVTPRPGGTPIQDAIDAANPGDLILVAPGTYDELVIMHKPVRLQGWGAFGTNINARKFPAEKLQYWRDKITFLVQNNLISIVPGQEVGVPVQADNEPLLFPTEDAGILVVGKNVAPGAGGFGQNPRARIDGIGITGSDNGGGIVVNGYANYLQISNNRITGNAGTFGGGIRIGHPTWTTQVNGALTHSDAQNDSILIRHNLVTMNGGLNGAGGGLSIHTGADSYQVTDNLICGNHTLGDGGGIGHLGLSNNGQIKNNKIVFNQNFNQGVNVAGGGIFIGGKPGLGGPGSLTDGSGTVTVEGNLIQGNNAGAGDGGGIRLQFVNGTDVQNNPSMSENWHRVAIYDNFIVNNVAGWAGGGISLQDAIRTEIIHNTVAYNDSTATVGAAFSPGDPNVTIAQPAGIVSRSHINLTAAPGFSLPLLRNSIVYHNRSFHWEVNDALTPPFRLLPEIQPNGSGAVYWDLQVIGANGMLQPQYCFLTDKNAYLGANNIDEVADGLNPRFVQEYFNVGRRLTIQMPERTVNILTSAAADEGGNFIDVRYGPLFITGNYHLRSNSPAVNRGNRAYVVGNIPLGDDIDGQTRPATLAKPPDMGADEVQP